MRAFSSIVCYLQVFLLSLSVCFGIVYFDLEAFGLFFSLSLKTGKKKHKFVGFLTLTFITQPYYSNQPNY